MSFSPLNLKSDFKMMSLRVGRSQEGIWSLGFLLVHSPFQPAKQHSSVSRSGKLSFQRQCFLSGHSPCVGVLPDVGLRSVLVQFPPIVSRCTPVNHESTFPTPQQFSLQKEGSRQGGRMEQGRQSKSL